MIKKMYFVKCFYHVHAPELQDAAGPRFTKIRKSYEFVRPIV